MVASRVIYFKKIDLGVGEFHANFELSQSIKVTEKECDCGSEQVTHAVVNR